MEVNASWERLKSECVPLIKAKVFLAKDKSGAPHKFPSTAKNETVSSEPRPTPQRACFPLTVEEIERQKDHENSRQWFQEFLRGKPKHLAAIIMTPITQYKSPQSCYRWGTKRKNRP